LSQRTAGWFWGEDKRGHSAGAVEGDDQAGLVPVENAVRQGSRQRGRPSQDERDESSAEGVIV